MVELFEQDLNDDGRRSSKGNQLKWKHDQLWYKADYLGYEGLSEYIISKLLRKSSLNNNEYVDYETEAIRYKTQVFNGCCSRDFSDDYQTITLERLFKTLYGISLGKEIYSISDHAERLKFIVDQVERATGIKDFGIYMSRLLTIDALFLNEDRHSHNISVLWDGDSRFKLCPIYDNGAGLLSDTTLDYPLGCDIYREAKHIKGKTFCESLDEQLDIAETFYGQNIKFTWQMNDVDAFLQDANLYSIEIRDRVRLLLAEQKRKYAYLFMNQ